MTARHCQDIRDRREPSRQASNPIVGVCARLMNPEAATGGNGVGCDASRSRELHNENVVIIFISAVGSEQAPQSSPAMTISPPEVKATPLAASCSCEPYWNPHCLTRLALYFSTIMSLLPKLTKPSNIYWLAKDARILSPAAFRAISKPTSTSTPWIVASNHTGSPSKVGAAAPFGLFQEVSFVIPPPVRCLTTPRSLVQSNTLPVERSLRSSQFGGRPAQEQAFVAGLSHRRAALWRQEHQGCRHHSGGHYTFPNGFGRNPRSLRWGKHTAAWANVATLWQAGDVMTDMLNKTA